MRILYLHQYFLTPSMSGGTRSYEIARRLVREGHEVHMITSQAFREETGQDPWLVTNEEGIHVHWCNVSYSNYMSYRRRVIAFLLFACKAYQKARELGGDVIYATSTPLTIALPAIAAKKKLKIPMVMEIRDLWPEAPIQLGILPWYLVWPARWLEKAAYSNAQHIVALTPGMRDGVLEQNVDPEKVTVITNGADLETFSPRNLPFTLPETSAWKEKFVLVQAGSMGPNYGLDYVLDAAKALGPKSRVLFVLIGEGRERPRLEKRIVDECIPNVISIGPVSKDSIPLYLASAKICLNLALRNPINSILSPNKMYEAMAAGKPMITNIGDWVREILEAHSLGYYVHPDRPEDLAKLAVRLSENPEPLAEMGKRARRLAEDQFSFDILASRVNGILQRAVNTAKHQP